MNNFGENFASKKIIDPKDLVVSIKNIRSTGKSIVTLNGSFDLLHAGHLHILYEASLCGDILVVALNSDQSIKKYKNESRPIIPLKYRLQMMASIQFVDYVTWFDDTDPRSILEKIKPDIHVNGKEYGENCIEAETVRKNGGRIEIINLIEGLSTSNIIDRIKKL